MQSMAIINMQSSLVLQSECDLWSNGNHQYAIHFNSWHSSMQLMAIINMQSSNNPAWQLSKQFKAITEQSIATCQKFIIILHKPNSCLEILFQTIKSFHKITSEKKLLMSVSRWGPSHKWSLGENPWVLEPTFHLVSKQLSSFKINCGVTRN